ncbi:hypothetical protein WN51_09827 [Melipona quadrifasciata]|uniref:Uncharacterized protein n=1 Tax=Melipona quadrifasciata TaxID=166423 RepID=A0A0M9A7H1_9HYME|nr:hypothetical protein WN51_09827 [Melipona quadrifasciata]
MAKVLRKQSSPYNTESNNNNGVGRISDSNTKGGTFQKFENKKYFKCLVGFINTHTHISTMHAVGLHSALAIKRQRKRRDEQRRARERRYSVQSGESGLTSPRASTGSLDHQPKHHKAGHSSRSAGQVFGAFLLMSGLLPGDLAQWGTKASGGWWNELVAIGLFAIFVGMFLIILNKVIAKKEENDLEEYVQRQLTRSRSGHRLERDAETGGLTTKHARRARQMQQQMAASSASIETENEKVSGSPPRSPPPAYSPPPTMNGDHQAVQSALYLEQITEEEIISDRVETSTTNSLSPGSPSETRELLQNPRYSKQNGNPQQTSKVFHPYSPTCTLILKQQFYRKLKQIENDFTPFLNNSRHSLNVVVTSQLTIKFYQDTYTIMMIGAMPAVAVRHERKRQEKRLKRPSQLYLGGQWMPPPQGSPPTPSPHGHNSHLEPLPELYLCGKFKSYEYPRFENTHIGAARGGGVPIVRCSGAGGWSSPTCPGCDDHRPSTRSTRSRNYSASPSESDSSGANPESRASSGATLMQRKLAIG